MQIDIRSSIKLIITTATATATIQQFNFDSFKFSFVVSYFGQHQRNTEPIFSNRSNQSRSTSDEFHAMWDGKRTQREWKEKKKKKKKQHKIHLSFLQSVHFDQCTHWSFQLISWAKIITVWLYIFGVERWWSTRQTSHNTNQWRPKQMKRSTQKKKKNERMHRSL